MAIYNIKENDEIINTIVADEDFIKLYQEETGYICELAPEVKPQIPPSQLREEAYNTRQIIAWENDMITITQAAQLWQYYAAEGSPKATELTTLIAESKAAIRNQYPD